MITKLKGDKGERLAAEFLSEKSFKILEKNYRYKRAEVDLIVKNSNLIVFVEVKYRTIISYGNPEDSIGNKKIDLIQQAAENYVFENNWQGDLRFDVISIVERNGAIQIEHFEDAF